MKRLSIIIPMYNVESHVERCIRSLEDQDVPRNDYEIICINDGSPDNSREVVKKMQKEYDNIILIDQNNQGVSVARNNGIDIATGKYLLMVDPDDFVKRNTLKEKLDIMDTYDLDMGLTGYIILNSEENEEYRYDPIYPDHNNILNGLEYNNRNLRGRSEIRDPHKSWAIFFDRGFINSNSLRYLPGVPYLEDGELLARVTCLAGRVLFLNEPFYMRTTRDGSATHSDLIHSERARKGFLKAAQHLMDFKYHKCSNDEQRTFMNQSIVHFTILYIASLKWHKYLKNYSILVDNLKKGPLKKLETKGCSNFYRRMGKYYNYSIHYFYFFWLMNMLFRSLKIRLLMSSK